MVFNHETLVFNHETTALMFILSHVWGLRPWLAGPNLVNWHGLIGPTTKCNTLFYDANDQSNSSPSLQEVAMSYPTTLFSVIFPNIPREQGLLTFFAKCSIMYIEVDNAQNHTHLCKLNLSSYLSIHPSNHPSLHTSYIYIYVYTSIHVHIHTYTQGGAPWFAR